MLANRTKMKNQSTDYTVFDKTCSHKLMGVNELVCTNEFLKILTSLHELVVKITSY